MQLITNEFKLLADITTALNSSIITLLYDGIIASDEYMCSNYRYSDINPLISYTQYEYVSFTKNDISLINKTMKETKCDVFIDINNNGWTIKCNDVCINRIFIPTDTILDMNSKISNIIMNGSIYTEDLQYNEDFTKALTLKASDAMMTIILDNKYLLTIFYGLFKVKKGENAVVKIYAIDEQSFLGRFVINKKKYNIIYNIRFRY